MKLTLVSMEEFSFPDRDTGELVQGYSYVAFLPNGNAIKFSSQDNTHKVHEGVVGFDPEKCADLPIRTKVWDGKVRYSEILNLGGEKSE